MAQYSGIFTPQAIDVEHLQAHPDFTGSRGLDITDSDGSHEFIILDTFCGIGKINITAIAINRCVFNDFPSGARRLAYAH